MHVGRRTGFAPGKICRAILLGLVTIALVIPRGDVAFSQSGIESISFTFTPVDFRGATYAAYATYAYGINDAGAIVGNFESYYSVCDCGFRRDAGGNFTTIIFPANNTVSTEPYGISANGQIVGRYVVFNGTDQAEGYHGFVYPATSFDASFNGKNSINIFPAGINDAGQIVGNFEDTLYNWHAFVGYVGNLTAYDAPNSTHTTVTGINNAGQIVGAFVDTSGSTHGFVKDAGTFTAFDVPNSMGTDAIAINNAGDIVGTFNDASGNHGFVRDAGGTFKQFNFPDQSYTVSGINNAGQIVGTFIGSDNSYHGFLGKPDPRLTVPQWFQAGIPGATDKVGRTYAPPLHTNFWGPSHYDKDLPNVTIGQVGCALTALTMLLNFWQNKLTSAASPPISPTGYPLPGIPPLDPNTPNDKMWPNNWPGLFSTKLGQKGWVVWNNFGPQFVTYNHTRVYLCPSTDCPYPSFTLLPSGASPDNTTGLYTLDAATQTLVNILRNGIPVILPILGTDNKDHHFVVVVGFDSKLGTFLVNDPGDESVMTLYTVKDSSGNYIQDGSIIAKGVPSARYASGDGFTLATVQNSLRKIPNWKVYTDGPLTVLDPLTPQALGIYTDAPVEFILTDPQGRRTGYDPVTNTLYQDIPASAYSTSVYSDELNFSFVEPPVKSLDMAVPIAGQYTLNVIGTGSGNFTVEVTASDAAGNWITQTYSGATAPGVSSQFTFQGAVTTFAAFSANVAINTSKNQFAVGGQFTLGAGSPGINPLTQPVTLLLGDFSITIPAGSFHLDSHGNYVFQGTINGVQLAAGIHPQGGNEYAYGTAGQNATNLPTSNPVDVRLAIGSNGGDVSVTATFIQ